MTDSRATVLRISGDVPDQELGQLALDLAQDLRDVGLEAELESVAAEPGQRGEVITLGQLAIVFLTGGAATALIGCLKAYLSREPSLDITIATPDGKKASISSKNIDTDSTKDLILSMSNALHNAD